MAWEVALSIGIFGITLTFALLYARAENAFLKLFFLAMSLIGVIIAASGLKAITDYLGVNSASLIALFDNLFFLTSWGMWIAFIIILLQFLKEVLIALKEVGNARKE